MEGQLSEASTALLDKPWPPTRRWQPKRCVTRHPAPWEDVARVKLGVPPQTPQLEKVAKGLPKGICVHPSHFTPSPPPLLPPHPFLPKKVFPRPCSLFSVFLTVQSARRSHANVRRRVHQIWSCVRSSDGPVSFWHVLELVLVSRRWCAVHLPHGATLKFEPADHVPCERNTGPLFECVQKRWFHVKENAAA